MAVLFAWPRPCSNLPHLYTHCPSSYSVQPALAYLLLLSRCEMCLSVVPAQHLRCFWLPRCGQLLAKMPVTAAQNDTRFLALHLKVLRLCLSLTPNLQRGRRMRRGPRGQSNSLTPSFHSQWRQRDDSPKTVTEWLSNNHAGGHLVGRLECYDHYYVCYNYRPYDRCWYCVPPLLLLMGGRAERKERERGKVPADYSVGDSTMECSGLCHPC